MKHSIIISIAAAIALIAAGCACNKTKNNTAKTDLQPSSVIEATVARNYFVNNTFSDSEDKEEYIITTKQKFNTVFSPAAFMGKDGEVTEIDFKKQFVLCVVLNATDIHKDLQLIEVKSDNDGGIVCNYRLVMGRKQSYMSRQCLIVVLDRKYIDKKISFHRVFVR